MKEINLIPNHEQNTYIYSCMYNCEKGIYDSSKFNPSAEAQMFIKPLEHLTSYENICSARELSLENILSSPKKINVSTMKFDIKDKEKILERVFKQDLSESVEYFVKKYDKTFGKREKFLWKWLGFVYKDSGVALSTVDPKLLDEVTDTKIIFTMFFSILDDVSEFYKDEKLMESMFNIVSDNINEIEIEKNEKLHLFKELWDFFQKDISKYPRYEEFKEIFSYDLNQMINSVRFCFLMNKKPEYMNLQEIEMYESYNMIVFLLNGIDLMASPNFDKKDLPQIRTVFWNAQQMARIGNWLSTWKREVKEDDFCSGVIAYALSEKIVTINDLTKLDDNEIIRRIENSNVIDYFTKSWNERYQIIHKYVDSIESVDINKYLVGLETLIKLHLASEGFK